ncbi:hypothetical protein [Bradyrhizobium sp. Ai1a-2]|uniref:hypothetical protein n=1 Tax=Bradyrhizobium sp. Ai1a-2 TaxID=196490 RepID=UPI0012696257|nr:hypothetical protein [Bradyrhizobium sp. Ai1a-2]
MGKTLVPSLSRQGQSTVVINMSQTRVMDSGKRLKRLLQDVGIERTEMECLELSARLLGFKSWDSYRSRRDLPLSPLDDDLTDEEFCARDSLQMSVLELEGLGSVARQLLDRCDPTGSWRDALPKEWGDGFYLLRRGVVD